MSWREFLRFSLVSLRRTSKYYIFPRVNCLAPLSSSPFTSRCLFSPYSPLVDVNIDSRPFPASLFFLSIFSSLFTIPSK